MVHILLILLDGVYVMDWGKQLNTMWYLEYKIIGKITKIMKQQPHR